MTRNDFIERVADLATELAKLPENVDVHNIDIDDLRGKIQISYGDFVKIFDGEQVIMKIGATGSRFFSRNADNSIEIVAVDTTPRRIQSERMITLQAN